jgi:hypothetical protein
MKVLNESLMVVFNTIPNDFYTAIGGRLYNSEALQGETDYPYCIFNTLAETPIAYFGSNKIINVEVQFSIVSENKSDTEAEIIVTKLSALYEAASLSVTGYTFLALVESGRYKTKDIEAGLFIYTVNYTISLSA